MATDSKSRNISDPDVVFSSEEMPSFMVDVKERIVRTGQDLLKPVNENPTDSSIPNPFVQARIQRLVQSKQITDDAAAHQSR